MKSLSNKKDSLSLAIRGIQPPYQGVEVFRQWLTLNGALERGSKMLVYPKCCTNIPKSVSESILFIHREM